MFYILWAADFFRSPFLFSGHIPSFKFALLGVKMDIPLFARLILVSNLWPVGLRSELFWVHCLCPVFYGCDYGRRFKGCIEL